MLEVQNIGQFKVSKDTEIEKRIWMTSWNHSGTLLASCGENKSINIWKYRFYDAILNQPEMPLLEKSSVIDDSHSRAVRCVNFSHCGKYLVSASFDASITVYELQNGDYMEVNKLEGHEHEVKCCAFSPSDEFLATCSRDKSVWFWQMDEDDDFQVSSILQPHTQDVKFVCWHPKADLLVSCSYDYSIRFYKYDGEDWITQQRIDRAHEGTIWCADFDAEGEKLVTVGDDKVIQIWQRKNIQTEVTNDEWISACQLKIEDTRWPFYSVSWNKFNNIIAVGCGDSKIRFFTIDKDEGSVVIKTNSTVLAHEGDVNCVAWNPADSSILASCSDDSTIKLWRVDP